MAFQTLNTRDLQAFPVKKRVCSYPRDLWAEDFDSNEWIDPTAGLNAISYSDDELKKMVKKMNLRNYRSQYHWAYCIDPSSLLSDRSALDEMMLQMKDLFEPNKTQKVLAPLPSSKRVMAFGSKDAYHTPLTFYQKYHSYVGYKVIQNNLERLAGAEDPAKKVEAKLKSKPVINTDQLTNETEAIVETPPLYSPKMGECYTFHSYKPMKATFEFTRKNNRLQTY